MPLNNTEIRHVKNSTNVLDIIRQIVSEPDFENNPFFVVDLDDICYKYINWTQKFPRIKPFYAVKCNEDNFVLKLLAQLGAGFDCASKKEIEKILDIGVSPDRIVYANPCKQDTHLKYSHENQVNYMTFDSEDELYKIKKWNKNAKVILRIATDDSHSKYKLSKKFGANMPNSYKLIDLAVKLNIEIVGISFHVGSKNMSESAFNEPIKNARLLFDYAKEKHGINFTILDIGGGYPGLVDELFDSIAIEINRSLDTHFRNCENEGIQIIAEPGTYFVYSAFTLCTTIIARRVIEEDETNEKTFMYYLNDGAFASFNLVVYEKGFKYPLIRLENNDSDKDQKVYKSVIWGPTCDSTDLIDDNCRLPEMSINEHLIVKNMGAYTTVLSCPFNGMLSHKFTYIASSKHTLDIIDTQHNEVIGGLAMTLYNTHKQQLIN